MTDVDSLCKAHRVTPFLAIDHMMRDLEAGLRVEAQECKGCGTVLMDYNSCPHRWWSQDVKRIAKRRKCGVEGLIADYEEAIASGDVIAAVRCRRCQ